MIEALARKVSEFYAAARRALSASAVKMHEDNFWGLELLSPSDYFFRGSETLSQEEKGKVIELAGLREEELNGKLVLDVGAGMGSPLSRWLAERGAKIVAVDVSMKALKAFRGPEAIAGELEKAGGKKVGREQLERFFASAGVKATPFARAQVQANALELPFMENTFDFVINSDFSFAISAMGKAARYKPKYLKEMHRVLKPEGRFLSSEQKNVVHPVHLYAEPLLAGAGLQELKKLETGKNIYWHARKAKNLNAP